jgi:PAS domain S-box-containing protein/putative nucleotidyltransferase with HDIG domain
MNILYIEDNPMDAELLIRIFPHIAPQIHVEWVDTIAGAKARLTNGNTRQPVIDLVLTDMRLPDGNGVSLLPYLQESGVRIAVVVLTGSSSEEVAVAALKAGASDYVVKQDDYLRRLPAILETAWSHFQDEVERQTRPLHVLYAEHNPLDIDLTRRHFARHAPYIHLECVRLASEVLAKYPKAGVDQPAGQRPFDVLLLDYHLSGMNGLELMRELLQVQRMTLPIILITGHGDEEMALQSLRLGAMDYVVKNEGYLFKLPIIIENAFYRLELAHEQYLIRALMENTLDSIYFKDSRSRFTRVSRSLAGLLGLSSPDQVVGKTDFDFFAPQHAQAAYQDEQEILRSGQAKINLEEEETWPDRPPRWVLTSKMPLRDHSGKITGTFGISRDITRRRLAELALQESEARYRRLFEDAALGIFQSTEAGEIITANPAYAHMFGFESPEEAMASVKNEAADLYVYPERRAEIIQLAEENPELHTFENLFRRRDGTIFLGNMHVRTVKDARGSIHHIEGFVEDITGRKQREREVEAIAVLSKALRAAKTRAEMLPIILDQVTDLLGADMVDLEMVDPASGDAVVELACGSWLPVTGMRIPRSKGLNSYIHETRKPYISNDVRDDPRTIDQNLYGESVAAVGAPLLAGGQVAGFIWFGRKAKIEESEVRLLSAIADIAANAINRVTLHEQTERNVRRLEALHEIDMAISTNLDLQSTLDVLLDRVIDQLHVDAADIFLLDDNGDELYFAAGKGFHGDSVSQVRLRVDDSYAGKILSEQRMAQIPDFSRLEPGFMISQVLEEEKICAYFATSLIAKGSVKGVLEVFNRKPLVADREWINFFEMLSGQAAIAIDEAELFQNLKRSNQDLEQAYDETIEGWSHALDLRDKETEGHSQRVAETTLLLAQALGVGAEELVYLRRGALLHDIGKMGIPDSILLKAGPLTEAEWVIMRQHPGNAYNILAQIAYLRPVLDIPYCHHEKWDGSGYPRGLKAEVIPLAARIFAVVDVWDALISDRPYRAAWPREKAVSYMLSQAGIHFDPAVVDVFIKTILGS